MSEPEADPEDRKARELEGLKRDLRSVADRIQESSSLGRAARMTEASDSTSGVARDTSSLHDYAGGFSQASSAVEQWVHLLGSLSGIDQFNAARRMAAD